MNKSIISKLKEEADKALNTKDIKEASLHLAKAFSLFSKETSRLKNSYFQLQQKYEKVNKKLENANFELLKKISEIHKVTNYLQNILQNISQGIIFIDITGTITTFNKEASKILEKNEKEVIFKNFFHLFHDNIFGFSIKKALKLKISQNLFRICLKEKEKELEVSSSFVYEESSYQGLIILLKDVTKIKKLELTANRNDRMKELGEMAATVAHEIKNPLGGIRGYASLLYRDLEKSPPLQEMAKYIIEGTKSLERIVNNVLHFSRPLNPNLQYINVCELIKDIYKFIKVDPSLPKKIDFELHILKKSIFVYIDKELFKSAILNLILNAFQSIDSYGKVSISVMKTNNLLIIEISDTGKGINEKDLENIFSPFFTTKQKGNGLGLSEAYKIIQAHLGNIYVRSQNNNGSTFTITIPFRRNL